MIAADQDRRHGNFVRKLEAFNAQAQAAQYVKVDVNWFVDGKPVMFDIKTPEDFVASTRDGRLHDQMLHMQQANCLIWGIFQVGAWHDFCGMDEASFDNEKVRLQTEGAVFLEVTEQDDLVAARRLASFWRWTRDRMDKLGGYHAPVAIYPDNDLKKHLIFFDKNYRSKVGMVMHIPDVGPVVANSLLEQHPLKDVLGATEEGIIKARDHIWLPTKGIGKKTADGLARYMLG